MTITEHEVREIEAADRALSPADRWGHLRKVPKFAAVLVVFVAAVVIFRLKFSGFLDQTNVNSILGSASIDFLLGMGMTLTVISGGIDLSVSSTAVLAAVCGGEMTAHFGVAVGIIVCLVVGLVVGIVNGLLIARLRLNAFIVTLAGLVAYEGLARLILNDSTLVLTTTTFGSFFYAQIGPFSYISLLMLAVLVILSLVLHKTYFGRDIYAVGGNSHAARLSGIAVERVTVAVYAISGLCAGIASVLLIGFNSNSVDPTALGGDELTVAAAVLLGGTALVGGSGGPFGTAIAIIFFYTIDKGLNLIGITATYWQLIITGVLLLFAVLIDRAQLLIHRRRITTLSISESEK
jgi:ribose transport system permease protein